MTKHIGDGSPKPIQRCAAWASVNARELAWTMAALGSVLLLSALFPGASSGL